MLSSPGQNQTVESLNLWCKILLRGMKEAEYDLTTRQTAVLLTCYLQPGPHSVKTLAEQLGISKPAICRAADMLCEQGLLRRKRDEKDKRQVTLQRTVKGSVFLSDMAGIIRNETREKESA